MDLRRPITAAIPSLDGPVLEVLAGTTRPLTGREIWQLAGQGSDNGVRAVLARLVRHGLVHAEARRSATYYVANRDHLAWPAVELLARLRVQMIARISESIAAWPIQPLHSSLFGSAARGDGDIESDIDMLVVRPPGSGDEAWARQTEELANDVWSWTGNHCQVFDLDEARLAEHVAADDPIVSAWRGDGILLTGQPLSRLIA